MYMLRDRSICRSAIRKGSRRAATLGAHFCGAVPVPVATHVRCAEYRGDQNFLGMAGLLAGEPLLTTVAPTGVTIPAVDLTRSLVVCSQTTLSSAARSVVTCQLTASNTVTLSSNRVNGQSISTSVVEFANDAAVQRGSIAMPAGTSSMDLFIATVAGRSVSELRRPQTLRQSNRLLF